MRKLLFEVRVLHFEPVVLDLLQVDVLAVELVVVDLVLEKQAVLVVDDLLVGDEEVVIDLIDLGRGLLVEDLGRWDVGLWNRLHGGGRRD